MNDQQLLRYARHLLLKEFGIEAQERFLTAHILVVGVGGLGSPAALYLATSGIGHLTLIDDDIVELSNLQRQILHTTKSQGRLKAESGKDMLLSYNPDIVVEIQIKKFQEFFFNKKDQIDLILDCTDNFETRYFINRFCVSNRIPLISGAVSRFEGQVSMYDFSNKGSPCYNCFFPNIVETDNEMENCATTGVFSPLVGIIGCIQAAEALKFLSGKGKTLSGRILCLDAYTMEWRSINIQKDPLCSICKNQYIEG